jgi:hypothetical protein
VEEEGGLDGVWREGLEVSHERRCTAEGPSKRRAPTVLDKTHARRATGEREGLIGGPSLNSNFIYLLFKDFQIYLILKWSKMGLCCSKKFK